MSDEVKTNAAENETLSPAQEKALAQQRAWKKGINIFNISYCVASVILLIYIFAVLM